MKKRKLKILFLLSFALTGIKAQQANDAAGGVATGSGGTASYSVGQVAYTSISNTNNNINEGVQQPYDITIGIPDNKNISLYYTVYPNPFSSSVNLKIEKQSIDNLSFQLFDISGKLILNQKVNSSETLIPMETLANANYFLKVMDNNKEVQSFKIIKN